MNVSPVKQYGATVSWPSAAESKLQFLHLLLFVSLAVAVTIWGVTVIVGVRGYEVGKFAAGLLLYGAASAIFVAPRIGTGFQGLFDLPVFMTIVAFIEFGVAPLIAFIDPDMLAWNFHGDTSFYHSALYLVMAGMVCFWGGAALAQRRKKVTAEVKRKSDLSSSTHSLILFIGVIVYLAAFGAKAYLLRAGMYSYTTSGAIYYANLAEAQVWTSISNLSLYALIILGIEKYSYPESKPRSVVFWVVFASECFWGLISGMKSLVIINFIALALISSMTGRRLRVRWLLPAVLGFIVIYPLVNTYRGLVRGSQGTQITSINSATSAAALAVRQTAQMQRTAGSWLMSGWSSALERVNLLQSVALLIAYQDRFYLLRGDERLWMAPIYPFIPRFLWTDKPILDKGGRFTILLNWPKESSTAITFPGDLYASYGVAGVLIGMFLLGLVAQWLTNPIKCRPSDRNLFIYACVFFSVANWELDAFFYLATLIRILVIIYVIAWAAYGLRGASSDVVR